MKIHLAEMDWSISLSVNGVLEVSLSVNGVLEVSLSVNGVLEVSLSVNGVLEVLTEFVKTTKGLVVKFVPRKMRNKDMKPMF